MTNDDIIKHLAKSAVEEQRTMVKYLTIDKLKEIIKETVREVLREEKPLTSCVGYFIEGSKNIDVIQGIHSHINTND